MLSCVKCDAGVRVVDRDGKCEQCAKCKVCRLPKRMIATTGKVACGNRRCSNFKK